MNYTNLKNKTALDINDDTVAISSSKRPADPYIVDRSVRHITGGQEVQFFEDQPPWTKKRKVQEAY
ncbi:hypothetical protein V1477_000996 [Vespula maculifrons]|uniref:Uncharacterized protein n=1 Tax=Vespula maculifrons TaxID=7453 RepID=A0ABD2D0I9_VESMC